MSAESFAMDLRELARAKLEESASCTAAANAFLHCLKLMSQHLPSADQAVPDRRGPKSAAAIPPAKPAKVPTNGPLRGRISDAIADIFRERAGAEITPDEIAKELTKRGVPHVDSMIHNALAKGVKNRDLRRCGDGYEAVKFQEAQR